MAYSPGYLLCLLKQGEAIPDYVLARLTGRSYSLPRPNGGRVAPIRAGAAQCVEGQPRPLHGPVAAEAPPTGRCLTAPACNLLRH